MSWIGRETGLARTVAFAVSAALHGVAAAVLIGISSTDPPAPLPMVAVEIVVAAPPGAGESAAAMGARTPRAGARRATRAPARNPPKTQTRAKTKARVRTTEVTGPVAKLPPLARRSPSEAAIRPARPVKPRVSVGALRAAARSARRKRRLTARPRPQPARHRKAKPGKRAAPSKAVSATNAMAYRPPRPGGGSAGNPLPKYPQSARRRGAEGRVVLAVLVAADGRTRSVELRQSSGHADIDAAALAAVRRWRFAPASRGGVGVEGLAIVPIRFRLVGP